jgi:hypothetical protein
VDASWQIDRFDLIYYNPRHKRWQFFAEDPACATDPSREPKEGLHRYLIRALLSTFHKAVAETVRTAGREFQLRSPGSLRSERSLNLMAPDDNIWAAFKNVYLDYLISTAWYDGVPDEHRKTIQNWFEKPESTEIPRQHALTFLSLLPILEDWDTWGCFIRARKGMRQDPHAFPPPQAQNWPEPFYVVELDFTGAEISEAPSKTLLDYPVQIEGLCLNLAEPIPSAHRAPKADFFDARYCKEPTSKEELTTYSLYAALVDEIMKKLNGREGPLRQFIIAYPVVAAGRFHFLQIALRHLGGGHSCVDCLWNSWQPAHRALWTPAFRDFLQEEMHRITTAAFQGEVYAHLAGSIKDEGANPDAKACQDALCAHIYHLFPVDSAWRQVSRGWTYDKYIFSDNEGDKQLLVGQRWVCKDGAQGPSGNDVIKIDEIQIKPAEAARDGIAQLALEHRIRQAIREQHEFLSRLPKGLEAEKDAAERDRQAAYAILMEWVKNRASSGSANRRPTRDELNDTVETTLRTPEGREPYCARYKPTSLRRYVAEAFPTLTAPTDDLLLSYLERLMRPSLLLQLSELFETGPVKIMSHNGYTNYFHSNDINELRGLWNSFYIPLYRSIDSKLQSNKKLAEGTINNPCLSDVIEQVQSRLTTAKCVNDLYDSTFRTNYHEPCRVRKIWNSGNAPDFRAYYLDPGKVLQPCFDVIKSGAQAELYKPYALYQRKLSSIVHPHQPSLGTHKVQRLDYYLSVFPTANIDAGEFRNGELCKNWEAGPCEIGDLLLHSTKETYLWTPEGFLPNESLHLQLSTDEISQVQGDQNAVVIYLQLWRTIESRSHREGYSDVKRGVKKVEIASL